MNTLDPPQKKIKFEEREAAPVLTALMIIALIVVYWFINGKNLSAYSDYSFKVSSIAGFLATQQYTRLLNVWWSANFGSINLWQLAGGIYFLALFGVTVEKRLGPFRLFIITILGSTIPWVVQYWDASNGVVSLFPHEPTSKFDIMYMGPCLITCSILGAYIVVAPPKKIDFGDNMPRPKNEIFKRPVEKPVSERYGLNPWTFVNAFILYQIGMHAAMLYLWPGYDVGGLFAAAVSCLIGYGIASFLLASAVEMFKDGPMKMEAIRRYNELVDLDVKPEDAIKGAARAMGLPAEQVKTWVNQNKNRLRIN